jgi:hypothetical protein
MNPPYQPETIAMDIDNCLYQLELTSCNSIRICLIWFDFRLCFNDGLRRRINAARFLILFLFCKRKLKIKKTKYFLRPEIKGALGFFCTLKNKNLRKGIAPLMRIWKMKLKNFPRFEGL